MMNIQFSPPDITEEEIDEVIAALKSGWITTGPKTKEFERQITEYCGSEKTVCLSAATTALEMTLRVLGISEGD
ncbi:MAG: DegT/DnrJ/EryC1/StrS family aminotransferase, partial [Methanobrevibacter sp.]|nr:DegT/DnrJ/EryC1/StrS family aminotransferase [Methanobrevibacter sp.]